MQARNDKLIYTVITDNYNTLKEPKCDLEGWDLICFTDDPTLTSTTWQIEYIPEEFIKGLGPKKASRLFKILGCVFMREWEYEVYVDANVTILKDPTPLLNPDYTIQVMKHPARKCIYEEGLAVQKYKFEENDLIIKQMNAYIEDKFPEKLGLGQNCVLIQYVDDNLLKFQSAWWEEVKKWSYRDQLSFMYAIWKTDTKYNLLDETTFNNYFKKSFGRDGK